MKVNVPRALAIGVSHEAVHSLIVSGATGVGKSFAVKDWLRRHGVSYQVIPLHMQEEQLRPTVDVERTLQEGRTIEIAGLLDRGVSVFLVEDFHLMRRSLQQSLLREVGLRGAFLIGTVNHSEGQLDDAQWEGIHLHVPLEAPGEAERLQVLRAYVKGTPWGQEESHAPLSAEVVERVAVSDAMITLAITYAEQAGLVGNDGERLLLEVSRALAALDGLTYVLPRHMEEASLYVLPHRMRRDAMPAEPDRGESPQEPSGEEGDQRERADEDDSEAEEASHDALDSSQEVDGQGTEASQEPREWQGDGGPQGEGMHSPEEGQTSLEDELESPEHGVDEVSPDEDASQRPSIPPHVRALLEGLRLHGQTERDRHSREGSGRRLRTKTEGRHGQYVRAIPHEQALEDLALDATLRAAAPYQRYRQKPDHMAIAICKDDYRKKERETTVGIHYLFVVDASGSMAAKQRMESVKGAMISLLQDAYEKRDQVGLIVFRKDRAELVVPFTGSVSRVQRNVVAVPTGGKTPLGKALELAYHTCHQLVKREVGAVVQVLLVTDGRATYGEQKKPVEEALDWAKAVGTLPVDSIVLDTEQDFIRLGIAKDVATAMKGTYYALDRITPHTVLQVVKERNG